MAPTGSVRRTRRAIRTTRRTPLKAQPISPNTRKEEIPDVPSDNSTTMTTASDENLVKSSGNFGETDHISDYNGCSTPKARRFRIPEIVTCPPAPKKRRVVSDCTIKRSPIAFFAPPDIELFFFFALRDISV